MAISGACGMCVFQCLRHLTQSPDVSISKSDRMAGVKEDKHFFKEGERFREHGVRRCGAGWRRAAGGGVAGRLSREPREHPALGWLPPPPSAPVPWPCARDAATAGHLAYIGARGVVSKGKPC